MQISRDVSISEYFSRVLFQTTFSRVLKRLFRNEAIRYSEMILSFVICLQENRNERRKLKIEIYSLAGGKEEREPKAICETESHNTDASLRKPTMRKSHETLDNFRP